MAAAVFLKNHTNRDISAMVWPIFTTFSTLMQNRSLNRSDRQKSRISQIQDGGRPPLWKKTVKSPYLCNRVTDFDEIWQSGILAHYRGSSVKISNFWKSNMAAAAVFKITKIAISPQSFDRSLRNLVRRCKMGLLTSHTVKKLNFKNPKWRTAAIVKTIKSPYLCNVLANFD